MDVNRYMRSLLEKELGDSAKDILPHVGFVEASIGRMVPVSTGEKYPTDILVEEFEILHTDKDGFVGEIPPIRNMIAYSPFEAYIRRKLFMHNMGHAVTAYLGAIKGYQFISEAIDDVEIRHCVLECGLESAVAIAADGFPLDRLLSFYTRLLYRFRNEKLRDTIFRVGRDTPRKLASNDRITGAINLCRQNKVPYSFLLVGVAGALLFNFAEDPESAIVFRDAAADLRNAIVKYTGITDGENIQAIQTIYSFLLHKDFRSVIRFCEKRKAERIQDQ
jgi:mannitol-1-phosphate 5-dehydrogenase